MKVIDHRNRRPSGNQGMREIAPNEARAASDQYTFAFIEICIHEPSFYHRDLRWDTLEPMISKVLLIKLGAIGDVALAARALRDFTGYYDARAEFHWLIDRSLIGLARSITGSDVLIEFHPIDASKLFRGHALEKARETLKLTTASLTTQPQAAMLLHRDWRYQLFIRPAFRGPLITIDRSSLSELSVYEQAFEKLAALLHAPERDRGARNAATTRTIVPSGRIGVLVGGARSQKVDFKEKRWPRMIDFIHALHEEQKSKTIVLFGGPEDLEIAKEISKQLNSNRIEDLVGKLSLDQVPAALATLDAFISIDSGLAHIAAAMMRAPHQKVITLFGPTNPRIWSPTPCAEAQTRIIYKATRCSPCYANDGDFNPCHLNGDAFQHCMKDITIDEVLKALA